MGDNDQLDVLIAVYLIPDLTQQDFDAYTKLAGDGEIVTDGVALVVKDAEGETIGWGVAACTWMATRTDSEATVELRRDGTARVACGTQDIGGGTYTAVAQIVSLETGIPLHKVDVVIGDSALPPGAISGGSWGTASVTPAVLQAAQNAVKRLFTLAASATDSPFKGKSVDDLEFANASVPIKGQTSVEMRLADIFRVANVKAISATAKSVGVFGDPTR